MSFLLVNLCLVIPTASKLTMVVNESQLLLLHLYLDVSNVVRRSLRLLVSVIAELNGLHADFESLLLQGDVSNCRLTNIRNPISIKS